MEVDVKTLLEKLLLEQSKDFQICGVVARDGAVLPLGTDTKVLSTIFELLTRPLIYLLAKELKLEVFEPEVQNHYPDFTLGSSRESKDKIAIDVKSTYLRSGEGAFGFTLGGYTSFLRGSGTKNIQFPYSHYVAHWVVGYVYRRVATKKAADYKLYSIDDLAAMTLPYDNVRVFVQEKWRIASDRAGSGNTTNIGSILGPIEDFQAGKTPFASESEYLEYWRLYGRTANERRDRFNNVAEFRRWKRLQK
jgi:hypothetical protein